MRLGNYDVIKEIAKGGFGQIYLGRHRLLNEHAALKVNLNNDPFDADLLKVEAKTLWQLDSYHSIPSVKDFFHVKEDIYCLVTDYFTGEPLDELIKKKGRIHPEDVASITERLLGALHFAHYNGIIHSDVKPGNVIIEPKKSDIKLIDWGLSSYKPTSATNPLGYTELFAAPELLQGKPPIPETDIYGTGLVMLYALGGDIKTKSYPKDTPGPIVDFCDQLLKYDPKQRPNWEKNNPLEQLADARLKAFGRLHRH